MFTFKFDDIDWLSKLKIKNLVNLKVSVFDLGQNLIMIKTSQFCSIHQENICKSCLHSNLIVLTDFHSFAVNEDKLQN